MNTLLAIMLLAAPPTPTPTATPAPAPQARLQVLRTEESKKPVSGQSLAEFAAHAKLKSAEPIHITDSNLKEYASQSELTSGYAEPQGGLGDGGTSGATTAEDRDAAYWQDLYQRARGFVAGLETRIHDLQGLVNELETRFYAEDDPARRDGVIKPAWDRALVDLRDAQAELDIARGYPDEVIGHAMQAGGLPGWFRGLPEPPPTDTFSPPWREQASAEEGTATPQS